MSPWRRNVATIWASQFLSIMGFSASLPFAPFYIQSLGVTDDTAVKFWAGAAVSGAALSLAVMSPIWGVLADRYGRKIMLLRANFAAAVIVALMSVAPNVQVFVALRVVQGMFTGTMTAAMTLVACLTPDRRQGVVLGALSAAVFSGNTMGMLFGGVLADTVGYRATFLLSGGLLLTAGLLVLLRVEEDFERPQCSADEGLPSPGFNERLAALGPGLPILVLLAVASVARRMDAPLFPLFVQELHGMLEGSAKWTGVINGIAGIGAMISGILAGRLCDHYRPATVGRVSALGSGIFMLCIAAVPGLVPLIPLRFLMVLFAGGLDPVLNVWLAKLTPKRRRGAVFGLAVTARSLGFVAAPLTGAWIAVTYGTRAIFVVGPFLFWGLIPLIGTISVGVSRLQERAQVQAAAE